MAAKASIQDITDAGFRAAQFGTPADWEAEPDGYLDRLLARAEVWSRGAFTGNYDATTQVAHPTAFERLRSAELCWCSAQLWKRRAAFIDANAVSSLENLAYRDREEFEKQAERAWQCALDKMAEANGDIATGTGAALVGAETGPWPQGVTA